MLQESQNGTTHFSEYVEIILCLILDLNAQNDWAKTTSIRYVWPIYHCVNLFMYDQYIIVSICLCITNILLCHLFMYDQYIIVSICLCMTKISLCQFLLMYDQYIIVSFVYV